MRYLVNLFRTVSHADGKSKKAFDKVIRSRKLAVVEGINVALA